MIEYEDAASERMAQLEQEDYKRYQRDIRRNYNNSYADEIPSYDVEFQRKLPGLLDMVGGIINSLKPMTSSSEHGSALPTMDLQPLSFIDDVSDSPINSDFRFEPASELHSDAELVVKAVKEINEMTDPLPTEIRGGNMCDLVEESLENNQADRLFDEMTKSIHAALLAEQMHHKLDLRLDSTFGNDKLIEEQQVEKHDCSTIGEMFVLSRACNVFDKMSKPSPIDFQLEEEYYDIVATGTVELGKIQEVFAERPEQFIAIRQPFYIEYFNDITLFDPGGNILYAMISGGGFLTELFGIAFGTGDNGVEGVEWGKVVMEGDTYNVFKEMPKSNSTSKGFNDDGVKYGRYTEKEEEYVRQLKEHEIQLHYIISKLLLMYSQVYRADMSSVNYVIWSKRPFVDFYVHVGALTEMCTAYDQTALRLRNGYDMDARNANIYFTAVRAHRNCFSNSWFEEANSILMRKFLYCWALSLDRLSIEPRLVSICGSVISLLPLLKGNFKEVAGLPLCIISRHLKDLDSIDSGEIPGNSVVDLWLGKVMFCFDPGGCPFSPLICYIYVIVDLVVSGFQRKYFIKIVSCDTSALEAFNGYSMKKTNIGKFEHLDVFLKMLVDHSNFALLISIYFTQNGLLLCDLVMPFSSFMQITFIMFYFYDVCEYEFQSCRKLSSSYDVVFWILVVLSQNAILLYILEDKDGFEGLEKKISAMVMIRSINDNQTDGKCGFKKLFSAHKPATKLFMFNNDEWLLQTEQGKSAWRQEAISIDITIIQFLDEAFSQLKILKSFTNFCLSMKAERNMLWVVNVDFLGTTSRGYDHGIHMSCFNTIEDFGLSIQHTGLDTLRLGIFELGLIAIEQKHFKQYSGSLDCYDVFITKFQNLVWDPGRSDIFGYIIEDVLRPNKNKVQVEFSLGSRFGYLYASCVSPNGFGDPDDASLVISTLELEHFNWNPGSFMSASQLFWGTLMWIFHFTTLRTRRFLRGRSCHE